jgi:hypothetical protein
VLLLEDQRAVGGIDDVIVELPERFRSLETGL